MWNFPFDRIHDTLFIYSQVHSNFALDAKKSTTLESTYDIWKSKKDLILMNIINFKIYSKHFYKLFNRLFSSSSSSSSKPIRIVRNYRGTKPMTSPITWSKLIIVILHKKYKKKSIHRIRRDLDDVIFTQNEHHHRVGRCLKLTCTDFQPY